MWRRMVKIMEKIFVTASRLFVDISSHDVVESSYRIEGEMCQCSARILISKNERRYSVGILKNGKVNTILLSVMMMVVLLCCGSEVQAAQEGDFTYTISDGKAKITDYTGGGGAVVIPSTLGGYTVGSIAGWQTFGDYSGNDVLITSIFIPSGVSNIETGAFNGCNFLTSISVDVNNSAFSSIAGVLYNKAGTTLVACPPGLTSLEIPKGVSSIDSYAIYACEKLSSISIPDSISSIDSSGIADCPALSNFTVDANNTNYKVINGVLYNQAGTTIVACSGTLKTINDLLLTVTSIGSYTFSNCTALTSITIPLGITEIGSGAFGSCKDLTSITVDSNNSHYASNEGVLYNKGLTTLQECPRSISGISIPQEVTSIASGAFSHCSGLSSISIPVGVRSIGYHTFYDYRGSLTFNSATTQIYDDSNTIGSYAKIVGYDPSTAKDYATKYNRTFELISDTPQANLQSIDITTPATKTSYIVGDTLDITGLVVTGTYSDGSTKTESITNVSISGFNSTVAATDQVLTITVGGKTATYKVQIAAASSVEWDLREQRNTTNALKDWTVTFNTDLDASSVNENSIYITNSQGTKIDATRTTTSKAINIKPNQAYTQDQTYYLYIGSSLKSKNAVGLKKGIKMPFKYSNDSSTSNTLTTPII